MTLLLTEIERFEGVAILATNLPHMVDEALMRRLLVRVHFPEPDRDARAEIWRHHLPPRAEIGDDVDVDVLAGKHECTGGYIKNAILTAVAAAVQRDPESHRLTMQVLEDAIEDQLRLPTGDQHRVVRPTARLEDLVLPKALLCQVQELLDAARNRRLVLERWGIGRHLSRGRGVAALFHGEPGTGKTLCAEVVARELNRPLLICDLGELRSKWVGETEKNLTAIFQQARQQGAVLLFDEADALLTRRGEGHASRHDDSAVNLLLQLVERHEGVVLLTTNLVDRLDPALERRLAFRLRFPLPDAALRARIWRGLLPNTVPTGGPIDFDQLGRRYELSGGLILNAVLKAAQRAAGGQGLVSQALLEQSAEEVQPVIGGPRRVAGFGS